MLFVCFHVSRMSRKSSSDLFLPYDAYDDDVVSKDDDDDDDNSSHTRH